MKHSIALASVAFGSVCALIIPTQPSTAEVNKNDSPLRAGTNFIPTHVFSAEDDQALLRAFEALRVADVTDGLDAVGLTGRTLMDPEIRPLWRDTVNYTHRFVGIAVTARYVPT